MSVLVVLEDDDLIASSLTRALAADGDEVLRAATMAEVEPLLARADLLLCDLGLPDGDGLELIGRLARDRQELPVIALTARSEEVDVVVGLTTGAVDYVTKPFRLAELQARIAAQLRQAEARGGGARSRRDLLTVGDLTIDIGARRVQRGAEEVALRPREFDLLVRLASDAGQVVSREDLMADVWDENWWGSTKTLDVHLNALRRRLGEEPGTPSRITAIRGVGYRFEDG